MLADNVFIFADTVQLIFSRSDLESLKNSLFISSLGLLNIIFHWMFIICLRSPRSYQNTCFRFQTVSLLKRIPVDNSRLFLLGDFNAGFVTMSEMTCSAPEASFQVKLVFQIYKLLATLLNGFHYFEQTYFCFCLIPFLWLLLLWLLLLRVDKPTQLRGVQHSFLELTFTKDPLDVSEHLNRNPLGSSHHFHIKIYITASITIMIYTWLMRQYWKLVANIAMSMASNLCRTCSIEEQSDVNEN